jgi:hypothetical protein
LFVQKKSGSNLYNKAICYTGLGHIYTRLANYTKAKYYNFLALKYYEILQYKSGIALCYTNLAEINIALANLNKANSYANKALQLGIVLNDKEIIMDNYLYLSQLDSLQHNYATALQHYKLHIAYRDSVHNDETIEATTQLTMQYEFDTQQQAQAYAQQQKDNATTIKWTIIIVVIVAIALLVFIALMYARFKQQRAQLQLQYKLSETELQVLRLQINPHFMFNALNSIYSLIISNDVSKAETYLIKFSRMLRNTLNQSTSTLIELQEELTTLTHYIDLEQLRLSHSFSYTITVDSGSVDESYKIPPLLLQPFVENALLHGLKNKVAGNGILSITINQTDAMLHITITDNGIGRKAAAELKTQTTTTHASKGIAITTQRIIALSTNDMHASVTIVDNTDDNGVAVGTSVHIQLPVMV